MPGDTNLILAGLPVLVPLGAGITSLLWYRSLAAQRVIGVLALAVNTAMALVLLRQTSLSVIVVQMGNWPAPYGITVAIDTLAASLLAVSAIVALTAYLFILAESSPRFTSGYFHPLYLMLLLGVNWAFITGDLFNLFVSFEVMLMASYVLLAIGTTRRQMRQAYKYVLLNVFASTVFVAACGWIYGNLGTLNFAELAQINAAGVYPPGTGIAVAAIVFVFAAKAAVFPLWFWLPDAYPTLPTGLGALYAALLTKVGIYALLRVLVMCFGGLPSATAAIAPGLMLAGAATMFLGGLGMAGATTLRRMFSCGILVGVGYMLLGPGFHLSGGGGGVTAMTGSLFYMLQHMLVIAALLLCGDLVERLRGTDELSRFGGLLERHAWLGFLFFVAALALVGIPPTSGFAGKLLLIVAGFERADYWGWGASLLIILTSALTLVAVGKAWCSAFWSDPPPRHERADPRPQSRNRLSILAPSLLVALSIAIGLGAGPFHDLARAAAQDVLDPKPYIHSVLGTSLSAPPPLLPESADVGPAAPRGAEGTGQ